MQEHVGEANLSDTIDHQKGNNGASSRREPKSFQRSLYSLVLFYQFGQKSGCPPTWLSHSQNDPRLAIDTFFLSEDGRCSRHGLWGWKEIESVCFADKGGKKRAGSYI